jgi:dethiobiotin synthetase
MTTESKRVGSEVKQIHKKIIFVTGTDTGVGKTLLTATLLHHLRQTSVHALAIKPFCSGGLADVRLLQSLQAGELSDAEANPFYFPQPIAPLVASGRRKNIPLNDVLERIHEVEQKCDRLIIEGSGGLFVPLGKGYTVADLIAQLDCQIIVVARNRLGTINHTLLTIRALQAYCRRSAKVSVVLMSSKNPDFSSKTNQKTLQSLLKPIKVFNFPFLGVNASTTNSVKKDFVKMKKIVAEM